MSEWVSESQLVMSDSLRPHGLYSPWNSPGQNTRVGSLSLLQRIFLTQESNQGLLHGRQILYQLSYQGSLVRLYSISLSILFNSRRPSLFVFLKPPFTHTLFSLVLNITTEKLLLNYQKTLGFLASRGEDFNLGPETRLDHSELLCNKVLLNIKELEKASDIDIRREQKEYLPASF